MRLIRFQNQFTLASNTHRGCATLKLSPRGAHNVQEMSVNVAAPFPRLIDCRAQPARDEERNPKPKVDQ